ncbi:MAG TPA: AI-2E family transporter, partial [Myxococcaceae bacterium]|nr:AI-2E family transporter [Myxococcaceae bacterium]
LIAYLVAPLVDRLTRVRVGRYQLPRWVAIILIYLAFFGTVYLAFVSVVPQLYRELTRITRDAVTWSNTLSPERISQMSENVDRWFRERGLPVDISSRSIEGARAEPPSEASPSPPGSLSLDLEKTLQDLASRSSSYFSDNLGNIVDVSRRAITAVLAGVFMLFFMLMVAAFFSIDTATIHSYVATLIPPEYAHDVRTLVQMIDRKLAGVVRGQVTICVVNGVLTLVGLLLLGVKFAFLLATVAMVLSLIPIFGSIISSIPIVLIGLSQSWQAAVGALLWIIGIHALEAYFLNPKIMGTAARIHPIVVAFALIAGERTYGLIGALFAVPIAAVLVACFDFLRLKAQPRAIAAAPVAPVKEAIPSSRDDSAPPRR